MQKIYCYIDESGQDTKGKMFVVSIVIVEQDRELLLEKLEAIEVQSRKGQKRPAQVVSYQSRKTWMLCSPYTGVQPSPD